jgi:predicted enzyme related to lactoylglutathione lyase
MGNPVSWFEINGRGDGMRLQSFYREAFGWRMKPAPGAPMMLVTAEKGGIAGGVGPSQTGAPSVAVYVTVKNLESHLEKIEKAGGTRALPPMDLPEGWGRIAGFTDPDGNWVGLWQPGKKPAAPKRTAKKPAPRRSARIKVKARSRR